MALHCAGRSCQAIAKAETVRGNAASWVGASTLCLGKTPGQDGLAALLLLVRGGTAEGTICRHNASKGLPLRDR